MTAVVRRPGGAFHRTRTARKQHVCGWGCGMPIEPGSTYVYSSLPPHTDANESDHWWYQALHSSSYDGCPHDTWVQSPAWGRHQARCRCGWRTDERTTEAEAVADVERHLALNERRAVAS